LIKEEGTLEVAAQVHGIVREALKNLSPASWSPDFAIALSWLGRRNGGYSEPP
jgi:hypothetical protein